MAREKDVTDGIRRRSILKKGAASASLGIGGISQPVLAKRETGEKPLKRLESLPEVRSILDELGRRKIPRNGSAETTEFDAEFLDLTVTTVEFGYGTLKVGDLSGSISAAFSFTDGARSSGPGEGKARGNSRAIGRAPKAAPQKYRDIPAGTDAWLLGSETGAVFVRTATDGEREAVLSSVPAADIETTLVYTRSDIDGFFVDILDAENGHLAREDVSAEGSERTASTQPEGDVGDTFIRYHVPTTDDAPAIEISSAEVGAQFIGSISQPAKEVAKEIAIQLGFEGLEAVTDSCGPEVLDCALGILFDIPSCLRCAPACTAGMGISGGVICFLCVFGICSWLLTGLDCVEAIDCVT